MYDLADSRLIRMMNSVGSGIHHTGVVFGCMPCGCNEVSFGGNGISFLSHGSAPHAYRGTMPLQGPSVSKEDLAFVLTLMRDQLGWASGRYCIAEGRCCVTFSRALVSLLGLRGFPNFADRGARLLSSLPGAQLFGDWSGTGEVSDSSDSDDSDLDGESNPLCGVHVVVAMPPPPDFRAPPPDFRPGKRAAEGMETDTRAAKRQCRADRGREHVQYGIVAMRPDIVLNLRRLAEMTSNGHKRGYARSGPAATGAASFEPVNSSLVKILLHPDTTDRVAKLLLKAAKTMK